MAPGSRSCFGAAGWGMTRDRGPFELRDPGCGHGPTLLPDRNPPRAGRGPAVLVTRSKRTRGAARTSGRGRAGPGAVRSAPTAPHGDPASIFGRGGEDWGGGGRSIYDGTEEGR